jgi:DnaJ-class molecular chaperone
MTSAKQSVLCEACRGRGSVPAAGNNRGNSKRCPQCKGTGLAAKPAAANQKPPAAPAATSGGPTSVSAAGKGE